jgi:drug/metabolite transporter (DMT)-like permease
MIFHGFFFAFSQYVLPLPIVHTIGCCGTLFVFLFDYLLNHVKTNMKQAIGIIIGLIGALTATNGKLITKLIDPSY